MFRVRLPLYLHGIRLPPPCSKPSRVRILISLHCPFHNDPRSNVVVPILVIIAISSDPEQCSLTILPRFWSAQPSATGGLLFACAVLGIPGLVPMCTAGGTYRIPAFVLGSLENSNTVLLYSSLTSAFTPGALSPFSAVLTFLVGVRP